jgi:galactose mutarotase-like enzyme
MQVKSSILPAVAALALSPVALAQAGGASAPELLIGGQVPITLTRTHATRGNKPEFLSLTVLPGRAMNLFQITAWIPGKGEVPLIYSPSLEEAAKVLGGPADPYGTKSFTFGAAFLAPFANRILGPLSNGDKTVSFSWDGKPLTLEANWKGKKPEAVPHAIHGLMLAAKTDNVRETTSGGTQSVSGTIHGDDFGGRWYSKSDVHINIALSRDAVIATVTVTNVGDMPEPVGIGWHPYFNLPSGDRAQARLHIPGGMRAEVNNYDDVFPTGNLKPVKGTPYDFTAPGGAPLGNLFLDDNWSHLSKSSDGSSVSEIIDPAAKYGLRIKALTGLINTVQVYAPVDQAYVALEPQFNINDPFGVEWKGSDNGMVTLQPGRSVTWKVKLELFIP